MGFQTEKLVKEFKEHHDLVFHLAFSTDDTLLASCSGDDVVLYDVRGGRAFPPLKDHAGKVLSVAFAPDDKTLASTSYDGTVKLWNLATRQAALTLIEHTGPVTQATFAPDGKLLAATGADGTVRLWPAPSLQEIKNVEPARPPQH